MPKDRRQDRRPLSSDQADHESAVGRGFLYWIVAYLALVLAFLIVDHPGTNRVIASHHPVPLAVNTGHLQPITRGS